MQGEQENGRGRRAHSFASGYEEWARRATAIAFLLLQMLLAL